MGWEGRGLQQALRVRGEAWYGKGAGSSKPCACVVRRGMGRARAPASPARACVRAHHGSMDNAWYPTRTSISFSSASAPGTAFALSRISSRMKLLWLTTIMWLATCRRSVACRNQYQK